jgi:predicted RecB family endonuclease
MEALITAINELKELVKQQNARIEALETSQETFMEELTSNVDRLVDECIRGGD